MAAKKRKSKRRSAANSQQQPDQFTVYIDRNLGNFTIAEAIRATGVRVEIHDDHLPPDAPDEDWIALVAKNSWLAITKDQRIRYRSFEKHAIIHYKAKVLVLRAKDVTGKDMGEILAKAINKIRHFAEKHKAPFIAGIVRSGKISLYPLDD